MRHSTPSAFRTAPAPLPYGSARRFIWVAMVVAGLVMARASWCRDQRLAAQEPAATESAMNESADNESAARDSTALERVTVVNQETLLFSAAFDDAYATDLLPAGIQLDVLDRTTDGWLAVRPVGGSFSWMPASKLRLSADGQTAEVTAEDAVSWIGSRVETVSRHEPGIRLRPREVVVILGKRALTDERTGDAAIWYQIQPPAGELRWLRAAEVTRGPATAERRRADIQRAGFINDRSARSDQWVAKNSAAANRQPARDDLAFPALNNESRTAANGNGLPVGALANGSRSAPPPTPLLTAEQFLREYEALNVQLSRMAAKPVSAWNLQELRERTMRIINLGPSSIDRGKARLLLDKIDEFAGLQQQYLMAERNVAAPPPLAPSSGGIGNSLAATLGMNRANADRANLASNAAAQPVGTGVSAGERDDRLASAAAGRTSRSATGSRGTGYEPRFDGSGWLLPVHSTKRVAPPYALMDDQGQVIQYVTPAPGVNLHLYERKKVGIYGQKGTAASLNAPMITAHRVVDLDRLIR